MKRFFQIVAAAMLLMFFGASGADCLVPNAGMSEAEKACCQQMAGQCDMSTAAKHPCCQKIVPRHDDADLYDLSRFATPPLSLHVATLGVRSSLDIATPSFFLPERLGRPPHDPPTPSVEILRV
jgi:hypothetical protein